MGYSYSQFNNKLAKSTHLSHSVQLFSRISKSKYVNGAKTSKGFDISIKRVSLFFRAIVFELNFFIAGKRSELLC